MGRYAQSTIGTADVVVSQGIRALVHRWLPGREIEIERTGAGGSTEVYRVRFDSETCWLRLAEDAGEDRSVEYVVHDRLRAMGVRVPEILMFEVAPPELDRSAALTSHVAGVPLSECTDAGVSRAVAIAAGEDLALINSIPVEGFGWIDRVREGEPGIAAEHISLAIWATEYTRASEKLAAANVFPADLMYRVTSAMGEWSGLNPGAQSRLAHGDFDSSHIYFDPDTNHFTGIIDFGEARGADVEYDLGHAMLHDGESGRPSFATALMSGWANGTPDSTFDQRAQLQALAIGTRQLAIMLDRGQSTYAEWLTRRVGELARSK